MIFCEYNVEFKNNLTINNLKNLIQWTLHHTLQFHETKTNKNKFHIFIRMWKNQL